MNNDRYFRVRTVVTADVLARSAKHAAKRRSDILESSGMFALGHESVLPLCGRCQDTIDAEWIATYKKKSKRKTPPMLCAKCLHKDLNQPEEGAPKTTETS